MVNPLIQLLSRRRAMKSAAIMAAATAVLAGETSNANAAHRSQADIDILTFALNLEYLEAEFYQSAVFGVTLPSTLTGNNTSTVIGGGRAVPFIDRESYLFAKEIADDELSHVILLQGLIQKATMMPPINEPVINLRDSFNTAAMAAGLGSSFDPFADQNSFLLGAFIFEDVGVTAYAGAAALISSKAYLTGAARILGTEAYHAGEIRTRLYLGGYRAQANAIAAARAALSGGGDDVGITTGGQISIVDADSNGLVFTRTTTQVLNVVYLSSAATPVPGGFFPNGLNGAIK